MITTLLVPALIALTGFGGGWWVCSYLGTWRLQKFHAETRETAIRGLVSSYRDPTAEVWNEAALDTIRKCMERTP